MVRTATPFPMVSLLFVFTAFVISNIGHIQPQRTILAFVSGIFFILSGGARYSWQLLEKPTGFSCSFCHLCCAEPCFYGKTKATRGACGSRTPAAATLPAPASASVQLTFSNSRWLRCSHLLPSVEPILSRSLQHVGE